MPVHPTADTRADALRDILDSIAVREGCGAVAAIDILADTLARQRSTVYRWLSGEVAVPDVVWRRLVKDHAL